VTGKPVAAPQADYLLFPDERAGHPYSGFPVRFVGADELYAFLNESRTWLLHDGAYRKFGGMGYPSFMREGEALVLLGLSGYRVSVIEGGASVGVLPQLRFGLSPISRVNVPPLAISACENHGLLSGLPLSSAD
jgi:hypothetical protein